MTTEQKLQAAKEEYRKNQLERNKGNRSPDLNQRQLDLVKEMKSYEWALKQRFKWN